MTNNEIKTHAFIATGRRKKAIARVRLVEDENNQIIINKKNAQEYLKIQKLINVVKQPLLITNLNTKYTILANVYGGGISGQAYAIQLGVAKAILNIDKDSKPILKQAGLLTRDSRTKERKKYGLKKARKAPQFSKR